ncbi:hypothetical protein BD289DRAFT_216783 [Coniella lustricola]|uniref:Uncharacterized protein n=1 Tax=Coniella lustricola TaxID=2025994 RepID=A0A2T3ABA3_9PEZI|nr:hypothetical protein BD289DRAFT_216783 [Coniella lustricola]
MCVVARTALRARAAASCYRVDFLALWINTGCNQYSGGLEARMPPERLHSPHCTHARSLFTIFRRSIAADRDPLAPGYRDCSKYSISKRTPFRLAKRPSYSSNRSSTQKPHPQTVGRACQASLAHIHETTAFRETVNSHRPITNFPAPTQ